MNFQTINASASPETQMNENFESADWTGVYSKRQEATAGLTWGYRGGRWGGFSIAAGTLSLAASGSPTVFNYVVVARATGVISVSTSSANWDNVADYARVYRIETSLTAVVDVQDHRAGPYGVHSQSKPLSWNQQGASYTLALTDAENAVAMNVGSANNLTIPANATVAFPVGTRVIVYQEGVGQTTFVAASGVTLRNKIIGSPNTPMLAAQFAMATLYKRGTNEWIVSGELA